MQYNNAIFEISFIVYIVVSIEMKNEIDNESNTIKRVNLVI